MFNLGMGEMIVLAAIALIAIGPKQLPEVARTVGRLLNELKRTANDFTSTVMQARDETNSYLSNQISDIYVDRIEQPEPDNQLSLNIEETYPEHQKHHDMHHGDLLEDEEQKQLGFEMTTGNSTEVDRKES